MTERDLIVSGAESEGGTWSSLACRWLNMAAEVSLYLLAMSLFTEKGNSLRSIGIYLPPVALVLISILSRSFPFRRQDHLIGLLLAFGASALLSSLGAPEPSVSLDIFGSNFGKLLLVSVSLCAFFDDRQRLNRLCTLMAIVALAMTILSFYDFVAKGFLPNGTIDFKHSTRRYSVILDVLLPFIPLAMVMARQRIVKLLWLTALAFGVVAMLLTGARGGWVALAVSLAVWVVAVLAIKRVSIRRIGVAGLALIGVAGVTLAMVPTSHITKRLKVGFTTTHRFDRTWKPLIENYRALPSLRKVIGMGLDRSVMYAHFDQWYLKHHGHSRSVKKVPPNPHNLYLYVLYTQGLVGLATYLGLLAILARSLLQKVRRSVLPTHAFIGVALFAALLGSYGVHGMVEDLRLLPLGFLAGMAAAYGRIDERHMEPALVEPAGEGSARRAVMPA